MVAKAQFALPPLRLRTKGAPLSNDPIRESLDQKLRDFCTCTAPETRCCACTEDCYAVKEYDATLRAVLDLPKRVEDLYDHWGYDRNCGYNEALADVREAIARALGVVDD
jgi:hypothetical protein